MGKPYAVAAIITMIIGSGYILWTSDLIQTKSVTTVQSGAEAPTNVAVVATSTKSEPAKVLSPVVKKTVVATTSTTSLLYENKELGFSFAYPRVYGDLQLKKFVTIGAADAVKYSVFSFPNFSQTEPYLGITVEGNEYDSGKDGISKPVCPRFAKEYDCTEKVNKLGTKYFEVHTADMPGNTTRYEFPLTVEGSLVLQYFDDASASEIDLLKSVLDSVVLMK